MNQALIVLALLHLGACVCAGVCVNVKNRKLRQCLKPMYLSCLTQRCIITLKQVTIMCQTAVPQRLLQGAAFNSVACSVYTQSYFLLIKHTPTIRNIKCLSPHLLRLWLMAAQSKAANMRFNPSTDETAAVSCHLSHTHTHILTVISVSLY